MDSQQEDSIPGNDQNIGFEKFMPKAPDGSQETALEKPINHALEVYHIQLALFKQQQQRKTKAMMTSQKKDPIVKLNHGALDSYISPFMDRRSEVVEYSGKTSPVSSI